MAEIKNGQNMGQIQIADDVLAIIAGTAALEVSGVYASHSVAARDVSARFAKRNFAKGVKINTTDGMVSTEIAIVIRFGYKVHEVSEEVQSRVKLALETMVGMKVKEVNVSVIGLQAERPKNTSKPQKATTNKPQLKGR